MFGPDNHYRDATVIRAQSIHRGLLRIALIVLCCSLAILQSTPAQSADVSNDVVKIGVLTDMTGPFADFAGNGSLTAITMAVQDFGGKVAGKPIEVVSADHQNKADVGLEIARRWFDVDHVDAIFDISNSGVALSVVNLAKDKNKIVVLGGVSSTRFTGDACTANSIQYVYDANALSNVVAKQLLKEGADTWFFITVDFAFGHGLEKATANVVTAGGGKVLGSVRHPLDTVDFAPYLLTAQASGAKVIALANGGKRHRKCDQGSQRVRTDQERESESRVPSHVHFRRPQHGPEPGARVVVDRRLLLGHERRNSCVFYAVLRENPSHADDGPSWYVLGRHALPEECRG
jgi:hypothetical protein